MEELAQVGKKRRRSSKSTSGKKTKRRRTSTPKEETSSLHVEDIKPEKKKTRYELFNTNERYELAAGDPVTSLPDIQSDNIELWVFQFPKNVNIIKNK